MGVKSTQVLLKKIIRLVIETGTATGTRLYPSCDITNEKSITLAAAIAIITLVLTVLPSRHPLYFITPAEILAKVYSNSMMVVLNNRMRIGTDAHPETNTIVTRLRYLHSDNPTHRTDAFELGEGVPVTREEVVFPCDTDKVDGTSSQMNKSTYIV
jgi:hypothetical protein